MDILYLVPHVPNPTKTRSYYHVLGLLQAGHHVAVATLERSAADARHLQALRAMGAMVVSVPHSRVKSVLNALLALPTRLPLQVRFMWSGALMRAIQRHLAAHPPDVIHVEHLRMAPYGLRLVEDWPVLWDAVDHLGSLYAEAGLRSANPLWRLIGRIEASRLEAYERWLTGQFPLTLVISRRDQSLFRRDNPHAERVRVAWPGLPLAEPPQPTARHDETLIITATFDYHPNVASTRYFVRDVLPLIRRERPSVRLQLVGARPVRSIRTLASAHIEVTGFVPSPADYLRRATVALAPVLYASGVQNKVLEAFQASTPLVATSTAVEGLDVRDGEHLLVADDPADFAAAVLRLLSQPDLRDRIGKAGRRYLEQTHDLAVATGRLIEYYLSVKDRV